MDTTNWRQITARYQGTCQQCRRVIRPGAPIYWHKGRSWTVHRECWTDYQQAMDAAMYQPAPRPEIKPEPERPALARVCLDSTAGRHDSVFTDCWIALEGETLFLSLLGADSYVKSISGYLLNNTKRYSRDLTIKDRGDDYTGHTCVLSPSHETHYQLFTTKSGPACHEIIADERFTPGIALERDYRFLLLAADQDPARELYQYLNRNIPSPTLPAWSKQIYAAMTENASLYQKTGPEQNATAELIPARVGTHQLLRIRTSEEQHDALISHLCRTGQVTF